jgi:branched-chain amino acid transport system ATP-binding protein
MQSLLAISNLSKRFEGVLATDQVSLSVNEREVHALIGPNGAGKTSLLAQISGELRPDEGTIRFDGRDITRLPVHRRAPLGLARSFQISSIFPDMTVLGNVALAVQIIGGHSFRFWRPARTNPRLNTPAEAIVEQVGLGGRDDLLAAELSHGEQRQLEIAMALASRPRMLLLDEPMAGMGPEESRRLIELLGRLRGSVTILLVEHDMDAVFALADRITVLVYGRVIATGTPAEIRSNAEVREAYLGQGSPR